MLVAIVNVRLEKNFLTVNVLIHALMDLPEIQMAPANVQILQKPIAVITINALIFQVQIVVVHRVITFNNVLHHLAVLQVVIVATVFLNVLKAIIMILCILLVFPIAREILKTFHQMVNVHVLLCLEEDRHIVAVNV